MGTLMAPSYANLLIGKFERDALLNSPHQPYLWLRFIDVFFHDLDCRSRETKNIG